MSHSDPTGPAWTDVNATDPGRTLLEMGAWLAERIGGESVRRDPYRDFNFRVKLDGVVLAGVTQVSALRRTAEIVEHREGGDPEAVQRMPGRHVFHPFALERPLGADTTLEDWADQLRAGAAGAALRRDVRIEILDQAGRLFLAYDVARCWPSAYRVLPDLTESLTLVPEEWHRDRSVGAGGD